MTSTVTSSSTTAIRRLLVAAALLLLAGWHAQAYLAAVWRQSVQVEGARYYTLADDAMISMRYARNFAQGHGLTWNPGERVEGITNLGWTLLMALVHLLGRPAAENGLYVQLANLVVDLALVGCVFVEVRRLAGAGAALLAAALVATNGPLLLWGTWGFETSLQALLCLLALGPLLPPSSEAEQARRFPRAMAWLGAAFVVRPDTLALLGLLAALGLWWRLRGTLGTRRLLAGLLLAGAPVAAVLVFQRLYYGAWLPNTFHLKTTGGAGQTFRGYVYLIDFCRGPFFQLPLLVGSGLLAARALADRATRTSALPLAACVGGWVAYIVKVGGDAFQCSRFFVPIVPLMAAATAVFLTRELSAWRGATAPRPLAWKAAALALVALFVPHVLRFAPGLRDRGGANGGNVEGVRVAVALTEAGLPTDVVTGVYYAGILPYLLPEHRFHDLLGKSDRHIARTLAHPGPPGHNKWDYAYSLGQVRPELVVTGAPFKDATDAAMARLVASGHDYGVHYALWIDPVFRELYRTNRVRLSTDGRPVDAVMWVYARRDPATGRLPLTPPPADARDAQGSPLLSIHPRLAGAVSLGRRVERPAWGLTRSPEGVSAWLGAAGQDGVGVRLKVGAAAEATVSFSACPGPGRAEGARTLVLTMTNAAGTTRPFEARLARCDDFAATVVLEPGKNRLRFTVLEAADPGVSPPLMARVERIRVGPRVRSGNGRLESILRRIASR